jgi:hypothetical protein
MTSIATALVLHASDPPLSNGLTQDLVDDETLPTCCHVGH